MNQNGKPRHTVAMITARHRGRALAQPVDRRVGEADCESRSMPPPIGWYSTRQVRKATNAGIAHGRRTQARKRLRNRASG